MRTLLAVLIFSGLAFGQGRPIPSPFATAGSTAGGTCGALSGDVTGTCAATVLSSIPGGVQSSITALGTIATGVWHGTVIGVLYGGTGADLSATGGANQVVKQATTGSGFTVGTLASTQLSDQTDIVRGGANLTTTGAVPFQSGTTATLTQSATFTFVTPTLTLPATGALKITSGCSINFVADGFIRFLNNATTGTCEMQFGPSSANTPDIQAVRQVNPYFVLRDSTGGSTANLRIPAQAAASGTPFVCIDSNGQLVKSTTACVGT